MHINDAPSPFLWWLSLVINVQNRHCYTSQLQQVVDMQLIEKFKKINAQISRKSEWSQLPLLYQFNKSNLDRNENK